MTVSVIGHGGVDHEKALLGACMSGWKDIAAVEALIGLDDFYQPAHAAVWRAILSVSNDGLIPDIYTVMVKMGDLAHRLPGGATYLADCVQAAGLTAQPLFLSEQIAEAAANRRIGEVATKLHQLERADLPAVEKRELAKGWLDSIGVTQRMSRHSTPGDVIGQVIDIAEHGQQGGFPTRWPDLDRVVSGWYPGQLITIGARPGVGKSIFGGNSAVDMALTHRRPVYFASLEMSTVEVTQRIVAEQAHVNLQALRTGKMAATDWSRVEHVAGKVSELPLLVCDDAVQSIASIKTGAKELKRRQGLGLVVVDYLQLVQPADRRVARHLQIGEMTRGLKVLARELEVPVIALAQLRRPENPNHPPTMSDLKESGDIEQDSDVVILLHMTTDEPTKIQAIVDKQRSGPNNVTVKLERRGHYALLS